MHVKYYIKLLIFTQRKPEQLENAVFKILFNLLIN